MELNKQVCKSDGDEPCCMDLDGSFDSLCFALTRGHIDCVKMLVEKGVDVHECTKDGSTTLILASKSGDENLLDMLIKMGVPLNAQNNSGLDAVMAACSSDASDNEFVVRFLISKGGSIHTVDTMGNSALHYATRCRHVHQMEALLDFSSDTNLRNKNGDMPIHMVSDSGTLNILVRYGGADINAVDGQGSPLLFQASNSMLRVLARMGACMDKPDQKGETVLTQAFKAQDVERVWTLTEEVNADPRKACINGMSIFHIMAMVGATNIFNVEEEEFNKVDSPMMDWGGYRPMHVACIFGNAHCVEWLVNKGANPHLADENGKTPLHVACMFGNTNCIHVLTTIRVSVNEVYHGGNDLTGQGRTALMDACLNQDVGCATELINAGARIDHPLHPEGNTLLRNAIGWTEGSVKLVRMLLTAGADANSCVEGTSQLNFASMKGYGECVRILKEYGAK